jgi:hypothetical protein
MWNEPTKEKLAKLLPAIGSTDGPTTKDKMVKVHLFLGGCDWYLTEYDPEDDLAFGFACLNGDLQNAEWGYVSIEELRGLKFGFMEIDFDLHWQPRPAGEVPLIVKAGGAW